MDKVRVVLEVETSITTPLLIAFMTSALQYMPTQFKLEHYEVHNVTQGSSFHGPNP